MEVIKGIRLLIALASILLLSGQSAYCSDIRVTNPALGTLSGGSTTVTFDVTWRNSWRMGAPWNSWDAACIATFKVAN